MNVGPPRRALMQHGFTLVEVAIVMIIVGLLLGGAIMTLTAQMEIRNRAETRDTLERAREALLGFAAANGRLPCTASGIGATPQVRASENCTISSDGFFPASTLAIGPTDPESGLLIDAWGRPIRYAVTDQGGNAFTTSGKMQALGISNLDPDLVIKNRSNQILTDKVVAVLISTGKTTTSGVDENTNSDRFFVSDAEDATFDDLVLPLSPYTLYSRMIAAGAL